MEKRSNTQMYEQAWKRFTDCGDKDSFRFLFDCLYERYCRVAFLFLKDRLDAEEVVLDVFLNLWKFRDSSEYRPGIESYLYKSVKNRSLNKLRDRKQFETLDGVGDIASQYGLPEFSEEDLKIIILDALDAEPDKCRKVFDLSRKSGMSNKEIAGSLDISEKSVEAYITRALKAIRNAMKKQYLLSL